MYTYFLLSSAWTLRVCLAQSYAPVIKVNRNKKKITSHQKHLITCNTFNELKTLMCLKNYHQWSHNFCCKSRSCRTIHVVWWPPLCTTQQIPCIYCDTDGPSGCTVEQISDLQKTTLTSCHENHQFQNIEINVTNYQKEVCCLSYSLSIFWLMKATCKFLKFIWIINA